MNRHQRTAIEQHCRLAVETVRPEFAHMLLGGLTVVLAVNSGYE